MIACSVLAGLALLEVAARIEGGYPLLALRLPPGFPPALVHFPPPPASLRQLAASLRHESETDIEPAWIDIAPPPIPPQPIAAEFLERRSRIDRSGFDEMKIYNIWNRDLVEEIGCSGAHGFDRLPMPMDVFDPVEPGSQPPYRYYPNRTTPLGLTTNSFGFRGPEIPLDKPAGTIRIAFLGASTTVGADGAPFSYPEYVVHWLNLWAASTKSTVRFDLVNSGRPGMTSGNIAAIARQEVLPLEPDLLVYYEGANQFVFADHLAGEDFPPLGRPESRGEALVRRAGIYSALAGRMARAYQSLPGHADEPAKPDYTLRWPAGVDRKEPDVDRADLPLELSKIVSDLRSIRDAAAKQGADLAISSFVVFVKDGMRIPMSESGYVYDWLNNRAWPYTYTDLRMLADFQNAVFERLAATDGLLFVDVAERFPMDAAWFFDAVHFSNDGVRLQAWIAFQGLLPTIRQRMADGTWPRRDREPATHHPNLRGYEPMVLPCAKDPSPAPVL